MQVSHTAYYAWRKRPTQLISAEELHLYRRIKQLFADSRGSLGSRGMVKKLRKEGIAMDDFFKNLLDGIRDMLTDEGRSYASGKLSEIIDNVVPDEIDKE